MLLKAALTDLDVIPGTVLRLRCDPNWRLDANWAKGLHDYDLWYVWGGRGRMVTSDGEVDLRPGVGLWMRPGRRYEATQDPRRRLGVTALQPRLQEQVTATGEVRSTVGIF